MLNGVLMCVEHLHMGLSKATRCATPIKVAEVCTGHSNVDEKAPLFLADIETPQDVLLDFPLCSVNFCVKQLLT